MKLGETLAKLTDDDLKGLIDEQTKSYINSTIREAIYDYLTKNFNVLVSDNQWICKFLNCLNKYFNIDSLLKDINYPNLKMNVKIKNLILKFFEYSYDYETEAKVQNFTCDLALNKRFYELLDYQYLIKEQVCNFVIDKINQSWHINKLIIHMPTGTGKTKTATHTIIALYEFLHNKGSIVWLAHTEELINQALNAFVTTWSVIGNSSIRVCRDINEEVYENCIYFISYQKLISLRKNNLETFNKLRDSLSICVCDEAHKCLAQETKIALDKFMVSFDINHPKTLIGLTATPGRKYRDSLVDGDNLELALMFDKNIFSINVGELEIFKFHDIDTFDKDFSYDNIFKKDDQIIKYFQDRGVLAKIKRYALNYSLGSASDLAKIFNKTHKTDYSAAELKKIGLNKTRNSAIIKELIKLDKENIPTIVFACSNEQGRLLSNVLLLTGVKNNCVFGDTPDYLRKKYIADFDNGKYNILINNAILTTGFDSPRIKCVLITRPTNSIVLYSQMLGRGLRGVKMGGNDTCIIIDVIDNLSKFHDENFAFNYFDVYWR